jgi:hypothetical protein
MKKTLSAIAALFAVSAAFGAANDTLLTFSTPGVDRYADGRRVLDGECYALVWTKDGATFGGIAADGKLLSADDKLVIVAPVAKNGKCPATVLEIDAEIAPTYEGGTFGLYLLDTRIVAADGKTALAPFENGFPKVVNAIGAGEGAARDGGAAGIGNVAAKGAVSLGEVGVRSEIESPTITSIKIEGASVTLEVEGMSPAADYFVVPGSTPSAFAPALDAKSEGSTFKFEKPADASFFKVIGVRKF